MANKSEYRKMTRVLNETAVELIGEELSFNVNFWGAMPEHYDNPVHRQSIFEICYVVEGEGSYCESNVQHPLKPGTLFCSRPGQWHQIKSQTGLALFFVAFGIDDAQSKEPAVQRYMRLLHSNRIVVPMAEDTISAQIWRLLMQLCNGEYSMTREMIQSLSHTLLLSFYGEFIKTEDKENLTAQQDVPAYIQRAKLYIEDNLTSTLSLYQLSKYLHITERHLSRLFTDKVGQSFAHYVQERRVQKSMGLLLETDWTISRIAEASGFHSVHYYTRVFTRKLGVPPGEFRATQLSGVPFN